MKKLSNLCLLLLSVATLVACSKKEETPLSPMSPLTLEDNEVTKNLSEKGSLGEYSDYSQPFQEFVNQHEFRKKEYPDLDHAESEKLITWLGSILKTSPKEWESELFGFYKPVFSNDVYNKEKLVLDKKSPFKKALDRGFLLDPSSLSPEGSGEKYTGTIVVLNPWNRLYGFAKSSVDWEKNDVLLISDNYAETSVKLLYKQAKEQGLSKLPTTADAKESIIYAIIFEVEDGNVTNIETKE